MNTPLHFLLRNVSFGGRILGLIKSAYHGMLSMMTSSEGPFFSIASGPPNLKPTTVHTPRQVGSQILVLRLPHFLHAPTRVSSDINNFYYPDNGYIRIFGI